MRLNVNKILHTPDAKASFHFETDLSDLPFGSGYPVKDPVVVDGEVCNQAGVLVLSFRAHTTLHCVCDRCAKEFARPQSVSYQCYLAEERESEESEDIVLLENSEVDLDGLARTAFILGMDTKMLCSEDCKGLCFRCGANLNDGPCACKKEIDPRLAGLAKLLEKDSDQP